MDCVNDTDGDGDCALCARRGGCAAIGGPFTGAENWQTCPHCNKPDSKDREDCPGYGLCHCGCGQKTNLRKSNKLTGSGKQYKGDPHKYLQNHRSDKDKERQSRWFQARGHHTGLSDDV